MLSFLVAVIPWIVFKITNGDQATKKCKITRKILRIFLIFIMFVIAYFSGYFQLVRDPYSPFLFGKLFQIIGLFFTFIVIIGIPWWNFKKVINGVHMCNNENMGTNVRVGSDEYQLLTT